MPDDLIRGPTREPYGRRISWNGECFPPAANFHGCTFDIPCLGFVHPIPPQLPDELASFRKIHTHLHVRRQLRTRHTDTLRRRHTLLKMGYGTALKSKEKK